MYFFTLLKMACFDVTFSGGEEENVKYLMQTHLLADYRASSNEVVTYFTSLLRNQRSKKFILQEFEELVDSNSSHFVFWFSGPFSTFIYPVHSYVQLFKRIENILRWKYPATPFLQTVNKYFFFHFFRGIKFFFMIG